MHLQQEPTQPEIRRSSGTISKAGPRILLAEDDREMRNMVATALRQDGYDVVEVVDGGELIVRLASTYVGGQSYDGFDLLICDIRMPVYSGLNILEALRRAGWATPMILMTAFGDATTRARVEGHGAVLFDKPFDIDDLRTAVWHMVHRDVPRANEPSLASFMDGDPVLELVATRDSGIDAWSLKWTLQAEGIVTYLGGRVIVPYADTSDIYVLRRDAEHAREIIRQFDRRLSA